MFILLNEYNFLLFCSLSIIAYELLTARLARSLWSDHAFSELTSLINVIDYN